MSEPNYDVIVVGAGLAGLNTARELLKQAPELKILVVEAKDRVGGRTYSITMSGHENKEEVFDLGGQWVSKTQKHVLELMEELEIESYPQYTEGIRTAQFGSTELRKYNSNKITTAIGGFNPLELYDLIKNIIKMESLVQKVDVSNVFSWNNAPKYDQMTISQYAEQNCYCKATKDILDVVSRTVYGVESNRVNMLFHLAYCRAAGSFNDLIEDEGDGAQALKVKGGTQQLSTRMAEDLGSERLLLNQALEEVHVEDDITTLTFKSTVEQKITKLTCRRVVLAIPPSECHKVVFSPHLPSAKLRCFESMAPGHYLKCIITYETAFWRPLGHCGGIAATGRTDDPEKIQPVMLVYDDTSENGVPALVVFVNEEFADLPMEQRRELVLLDLTRYFGEKAIQEKIDYHEKVWAHEPYNGGCPVGVVPPGLMDSWQSLRDPYLSIHFAGTETATQWIGYMSGAIESGFRAAHEVLFELGTLQEPSPYLIKTKYDDQHVLTRPAHQSYIPSWLGWKSYSALFLMGVSTIYLYGSNISTVAKDLMTRFKK